MSYEELVRNLSHMTDIPNREIDRVFYLLGEIINKQKFGEEVELPFGYFGTKLLKPKVVKKINRVEIYGPVEYTVSFTPKDDMVFEVPDPEGIASGRFNAGGLYQMAMRRRHQGPPIEPAIWGPESLSELDHLGGLDGLEWSPPVSFEDDSDE